MVRKTCSELKSELNPNGILKRRSRNAKTKRSSTYKLKSENPPLTK